MQECLGKYYMHNGKLQESSLFDTSFLSSSHYIYEVFRVIDGVALFLEDHLQRLKKTCEMSKHCPGFSPEEIFTQVYKLINRNHLKAGNVKIVLYRDARSGVHLLVYIHPHQYPTHEDFQNGVAVTLFKGERDNPNAKIMDVKLRQATNVVKQKQEVYETLLVDSSGCITEGSRSNVFFIRNNQVITPPLADVLPGITRKHIVEICRELHVEVRQEKVLARSLVVMEALFISGTSRKVLPVNRVDELEFEALHPVTLKIMEAFDQKVQQYIHQKQKH